MERMKKESERMGENVRIKQIQQRAQELYDISLSDFTEENRQELVKLREEAKAMGYKRDDGGDIASIRFIEIEREQSPTTWLWNEIERRFGKDAAADLHRDYNAQLQSYQQRQQLKTYRRQLPGMEWQRTRRREAGKSTTALDKSIALRRERLREAEQQKEGEIQ